MSAASPLVTTDAPPKDAPALVSRIVPLGTMIVDMAGFLDGIEAAADGNLNQIAPLQNAADTIDQATNNLIEDFVKLRDVAVRAETSAAEGLQGISTTVRRFSELAEWGTGIEGRTNTLEEVLEKIVSGNAEIARIARQVNILAINASIEAARAGEAGRGFAVVAEAVGDLSRKTSVAAEEISHSIVSLDEWTKALREDAQRLTPEFIEGRNSAQTNQASITEITSSMAASRECIDEMALHTDTMREAGMAIRPAVEAVEQSAKHIAGGIHETRDRTEKITDSCEGLLQEAASREGAAGEARFIEHVQSYAAQVGAVFEEALNAGRISETDLFSLDYKPIPGTNPEQHLTPCTRLCEEVLPTLTEKAGNFDPATVFCCAADRGGYIAVHNKKFSKPQGDDPAWNAAHSRNRRIFNDRVGLKAGRNTKPFLLQIYRRDMGAEGIVMMKDVSAPVFVRGRHWGCIRMGYRQTK